MRNHGFAFARARVNKRSIVTTGPTLVVFPPCCAECGWPLADAPVLVAGIDPKDHPKVTAHRRRKGWEQ